MFLNEKYLEILLVQGTVPKEHQNIYSYCRCLARALLLSSVFENTVIYYYYYDDIFGKFDRYSIYNTAVEIHRLRSSSPELPQSNNINTRGRPRSPAGLFGAFSRVNRIDVSIVSVRVCVI